VCDGLPTRGTAGADVTDGDENGSDADDDEGDAATAACAEAAAQHGGFTPTRDAPELVDAEGGLTVPAADEGDDDRDRLQLGDGDMKFGDEDSETGGESAGDSRPCTSTRNRGPGTTIGRDAWRSDVT